MGNYDQMVFFYQPPSTLEVQKFCIFPWISKLDQIPLSRIRSAGPIFIIIHTTGLTTSYDLVGFILTYALGFVLTDPKSKIQLVSEETESIINYSIWFGLFVVGYHIIQLLTFELMLT